MTAGVVSGQRVRSEAAITTEWKLPAGIGPALDPDGGRTAGARRRRVSASSSIECPLRNQMSRRPQRGAAFAEPRPTTIAFVVVGVAPVPVLAHAVTVALCGAATALNRVDGDRGAAHLPRAAEVTLPVTLRDPYAALGSHDGEQPSCKRHQPALSGSGEFADDRVLAGAVREPGLEPNCSTSARTRSCR